MHPAGGAGGERVVPKGRGRGQWRQGQEHKELRRPQSDNRIGFPANNSNSVPDPGAGGDISRNSTLSATAKEFYPKGYQTLPVEDGYNSYQFEEAPPEGGDCLRNNLTSPTSQTTPEQVATNHLIEVMQHLTLNPGKFDVLITPLVHTFSLWLGDRNIVYSIVDAIVEQSITEPNFRYNGARLCNFLNNEFPPGEKSTFRSCLLTRCHEEHQSIPTYIHADPRRLHGYVLFVAELFMQLELVNGQRITIFGTALLEALSRLLTEPSSENIKCVCQVLKLTGQPLDAQDPITMTKIMQSLLKLYSSSNVEPNVRLLISSVIDLRNQCWGEASNFMPHASTTQEEFIPYPTQNEPVFYGPDGQIMTPEESQFLQENVERIPDAEEYDEYSEDGLHWEQDEEMDEEIQAAYEQFLQMGKNQSKENKTTDKSSG